MNQKNNLIMLAIAILVGLVGFYTGTLYQKNQNPRFGFNGENMMGNTRRFDDGGRRGMMNSGGRNGGFRPVVGQILSQDDKSITVKMTDGSSRIILLSDTTDINKAETVDKNALTVGQTVRVFGIVNSDGSVTAQDIQLNPTQPQQ